MINIKARVSCRCAVILYYSLGGEGAPEEGVDEGLMDKVNPKRSFAEPFEQFAPPGYEKGHKVVLLREVIGVITAQEQKQPRQKREIVRREEVLPRKAEKCGEISGVERLRQVK